MVGLAAGKALAEPGQNGTEEGIDEPLWIGLKSTGNRQPAVNQHDCQHALRVVGGQPGHDVGAERMTDGHHLLEPQPIEDGEQVAVIRGHAVRARQLG